MKKYYIIGFSLLILSTFFYSSYQTIAQSSSEYRLDGYAWSSNIGWISFSDENSKVEVDSSGNLNGYAWSSNVGWLQFGGLSNFPTSDPGATASNAKISEGKIVGWAKFVAGNNSSGWDGWVLFDGTTHSILLNSSTDKFSGYAWGDDVVGWVDFSGVSLKTTTGLDSLACSVTPKDPDINEDITYTATSIPGATYEWFNPDNPGTTLSNTNVYIKSGGYSSKEADTIRTVKATIGDVTKEASCTVKFKCEDKPDDVYCPAPNGSIKSKTYDSSCNANGTWNYTPQSCPGTLTGDTATGTFSFIPNIASSGDNKCPLVINIKDTSGCTLTRRGGATPISIATTTSGIIKPTIPPRYSVGTYTLSCTSMSDPASDVIIGTKTCYSNPNVRED